MKASGARSVATLAASLAAFAVFAQDADAGKLLFAPCAACHSVDGADGAGPTLKGIVGRQAGSVPGFRYSRALKTAAIVWDATSIDQYLADPQQLIPGNLMPFGGLADAKDRAALIAYLKSL